MLRPERNYSHDAISGYIRRRLGRYAENDKDLGNLLLAIRNTWSNWKRGAEDRDIAATFQFFFNGWHTDRRMQGRKKNGCVRGCVFGEAFLKLVGIVMVLGGTSSLEHEDSTDHMRHCCVLRWLAWSLGFTTTAKSDWWKHWMAKKGDPLWSSFGRVRMMTQLKGGSIEAWKAQEFAHRIGMLYTIYNMMKQGPAPLTLEELKRAAQFILDDVEGRRGKAKKRVAPRNFGDG